MGGGRIFFTVVPPYVNFRLPRSDFFHCGPPYMFLPEHFSMAPRAPHPYALGHVTHFSIKFYNRP